MTTWPVHARISGPIVMIGFGSIGKGTLPLIERHFHYDKSRFVVIDPEDKDRHLLDQRGIKFIKKAVSRDNYRELLAPLLTAGGGQGFCVNVSVDTSSVDIMELCREIGAFYIDTVVEPWLGFYFDSKLGPEGRSNYALRESMLEARRRKPGGTTAVSHRRARHPARQAPQAAGRVRQHLVGRRLCRRGSAAGRARLGHA
jgi:homospermidine synthase